MMTTAVGFQSTAALTLGSEPTPTIRLRSNKGDYVDSQYVGWLRETTRDTPIEEMRRRFLDDGYVLVKSLLPREDVYDVRQAYFDLLAPTDILKPGTSPRAGIFNSTQDPVVHNGVGGTDLPESKERIAKLVSAHVEPTYLNFLEHPDLRGFVREFMGWKNDVLVKRTLLRHNVPQGQITGIHYDQIFLRAGESEFLTAWVPFGDCKANGGGLMYLEHSDDIGREMEEQFTKRAASFTQEQRLSAFNQNMMRDGQLWHDAKTVTEDIIAGKHGGAMRHRRWLAANYEAGDIVFHNPYLIHGGVKNDDTDGNIRLSTDLRFYEEGSSLDERWTRDVWKPDDGL